jgi:hypothetical protein
MLETEIVKLREAIEALTTALENQPTLPIMTEAQSADAGGVINLTVEDATAEDQDKPDDTDLDTLKAEVLKASRAGYKDIVRTKLADMGVRTLTELSAPQRTELYVWLMARGDN